MRMKRRVKQGPIRAIYVELLLRQIQGRVTDVNITTSRITSKLIRGLQLDSQVYGLDRERYQEGIHNKISTDQQ